MTLAELFRSTAFRLAAMFVALFSAAMIVAFLIVYWQAGSLLDRHLVDRLSETRDALLMVAARDGYEDLQSVVQSEATTLRGSDTILLMIDRDGKFLAGNTKSIEPFSGTRWIPRATIPEMVSRAAYNDSFASRWTSLEGGKLLVGVSDRDVQATRGFILSGLGLGLIGMLSLAGFSGLWLAHRAQNRVDTFATTLRAVARGKLNQRVRLSGRGDDLDQVGEQLNAALDRLERLIEHVNQSASAIAHELRSPIGRVRQKLERLLGASEREEFQQDVLHSAIVEVDRVVEIIEAILRIGQIQAGARRDRMAPVDLAVVIADVAEVYEPVIEEAAMTVACLPPMTSAPILGDQPLLTQMFANLIENSIRHCGAGKKIELSLDASPEGPIATVSDNGPGIPDSEWQRVLEPFTRLDKSRTTPGAGLGLSLVAAIAELHNARLVLANNGPGLAVSLHFKNLSPAS